MAYTFKRKESVSKAVKRLNRERIEHALDCLKDPGRPEAVHCARKDIKKVRAVLRLVRARISKKEYRRLTAILRDAATRLACARDAYVKAQTLQKLAEHFRGQLAAGALRNIRVALRHSSAQEMQRVVNGKTAVAVERILRRERTAFNRIKIKGKGWKVLSPGVKAAYRQGRRAFRGVQRDSSPENFHVWRKRTKDLWYHARLLHPVWPEQMEAIASELEALSENLGDDHDLAVLQKDIVQRFAGRENERELETLDALVEQHQGELRAAALALGARLYAEKPSFFHNRLAGYWKAWRRDKRPFRKPAGASR